MTDPGWGQSLPPTSGLASPPAGGGVALASEPHYPIQIGLNAPLEVARWRVIGNYVLAIPHVIVLDVLLFAAYFVAIVAWFAVLFTGRMPEGMGSFLAGVHRYQWRVFTYILFLREPYPAFGVPSGYAEPGGDPAWLVIAPPQRYSRLAVFFRGILAIPQALYLFVMAIGLYGAWIVAFFAVLFTGRWPVGIRRFVVGVGFTFTRYNAWYNLLTDVYPPFSTR